MIISIINHSNGIVSDDELQPVVRAINRQIAEDFEPYWSMGATLRLDGRSEDNPSKLNMLDLRGDAIIYLWDKTDIPGALGYHDQNARGIPYGFVFMDLAKKLGEPWSVTLSHETLELLGDAQVNLLAMGPHPGNAAKTVFHWFEMCDAVQAETYKIDGVEVSNFVLPLYFTGSDEPGGRNDFLGRNHNGNTLNSFGVNQGGYVGFFDPETGKHETFARPKDKTAAKRLTLKGEASAARRAIRYQRFMASGVDAKQPIPTGKQERREFVQSSGRGKSNSTLATTTSGNDRPGTHRKTGI
jgi:hypothetical protein